MFSRVVVVGALRPAPLVGPGDLSQLRAPDRQHDRVTTMIDGGLQMTTQRRTASLIRRSAAGAAVLVVLVTAGCSTTTAGAPVTAAAGPNAPGISAPGSTGADATGADATGTPAPDDKTTDDSVTDPSTTDESSAESSRTSADSSESAGSTSPSTSGPASSPAAPTASGRSTADSSAPGSAAGNGPAPAGKQVNLRSIDPCTFFAKDTFDSLDSQVQGSLSYADLASCHLLFTGTNAKNDVHTWNVDIAMDAQYSTPAALAAIKPGDYSTTSRNGTSVIAGKTKKGECLRAFQLPGDIATAVIEVTSKSDPCKAADLALDGAIKAVDKGELEAVTWPRGSLIPVDLCTTFQSMAAAELGAAVTAKPLGLHTCVWSTADGRAVSMNLAATPWPPLGFDTTATKQTIAGHPAVTMSHSGSGQFMYLGAVNLGAIPVGVENSVQTVEVLLGGKGDGKPYQQTFPRLLAAITVGH